MVLPSSEKSVHHRLSRTTWTMMIFDGTLTTTTMGPALVKSSLADVAVAASVVVEY